MPSHRVALQGQIQDFSWGVAELKKRGHVGPCGPHMAPNIIFFAQKMGPFPAGAGAKAPWPPPLDPSQHSTTNKHSMDTGYSVGLMGHDG